MPTASFTRGLTTLLVGATLGALTIQPSAASAQAKPPVMVVRSYDTSVTPPASTLVYFAPGNGQAIRTVPLVGDVKTIALSFDGLWIAQTQNDAQANISLSYGQVGKQLVTQTTDPGSVILRPQFSPDTRYLTYTIANYSSGTAGTWQFHVVELATGARKVFAGTTDFSAPQPPPGSLAGVPVAVAWPMMGPGTSTQKLIVVPVGTDLVGTVGLFEVDLSAAPWAAAGQPVVAQPFPPVRNILPPELQQIKAYNIQLSDDQMRLAFGYADAKRPVPNFVGYGEPTNTIQVLNAMTGQLEARIEAEPNQAITTFAWAAYGSQLLHVSGGYVANAATGGSDLTDPILSIVDPTSGALLGRTAANAAQLRACGDSVFYTTVVQDSTQTLISLFSAPNDALNQPKQLATSIFELNLIQCVPQS